MIEFEVDNYGNEEHGLDERDKLMIEVVSNKMAKEGLKTLSYAYKEMPIDDLKNFLD